MRSATFLLTILTLAGCRSVEIEPPITLVLENVTLVDVRDGSQDAGVTIVVRGERVASIEASTPSGLPPEAEVIDGAGKWVMPGLIDVHVHDASEGYLRDLLAWGVTAIHLMPRSTEDDPAGMELASEAAQAPVPRLQLSEMFAGEFPDNIFPGVYSFLKPGTVDEARRMVRESHARGLRQIKIIRDDSFAWSGEEYRVPLMPQPIFDALVEEAHELDMRVYVHATQRDVARAALAAGVDAFLHGVMDDVLTAEDWQRMAASRCSWAPTVNALLCFGEQRGYARRVFSDERFVALLDEAEREQWWPVAQAEQPVVMPQTTHLVEHTESYVTTLDKNTWNAIAAGIPVAVGTDGGPAGISTHLELELLQVAGLSTAEILKAATHGGSVALGREADLGSIEVGKLADLVILNADPTASVRNCREIAGVVKGGVLYEPRELALGPWR